MITQQELTDKCTLEIIKKMVELAEGFEKWKLRENYDHEQYLKSDLVFPLLIHRAVEGWNKKNKDKAIDVLNFKDYIQVYHTSTDNKYDDIDYQPTTLTHSEMAMLDCLIDIFEEERK